MKVMLGILLIISLSGCSWWQKVVKPVVVEERVEQAKIFHPQLPPKISLSWNLKKWKVLTPAILEKYMKAYAAGDADPLVVYYLNIEDYKLLGINMAKIKKLMQDQKDLIIHYRSLK